MEGNRLRGGTGENSKFSSATKNVKPQSSSKTNRNLSARLTLGSKKKGLIPRDYNELLRDMVLHCHDLSDEQQRRKLRGRTHGEDDEICNSSLITTTNQTGPRQRLNKKSNITFNPTKAAEVFYIPKYNGTIPPHIQRQSQSSSVRSKSFHSAPQSSEGVTNATLSSLAALRMHTKEVRNANFPYNRHTQEKKSNGLIENSYENNFALDIPPICEMNSLVNRIPDVIRNTFRNYPGDETIISGKGIKKRERINWREFLENRNQNIKQHMGAVMGGYEGGTSNFLRRRLGQIQMTNPELNPRFQPYRVDRVPWAMEWRNVKLNPDFSQSVEFQRQFTGQQQAMDTSSSGMAGVCMPWEVDLSGSGEREY